MPDFKTIAVTRSGQIATVTIQSKDRTALTGPHVEIGAALAKRAANRVYVERFNLSYDLAWSYELLNFFQHGHYVDGRGASTL